MDSTGHDVEYHSRQYQSIQFKDLEENELVDKFEFIVLF